MANEPVAPPPTDPATTGAPEVKERLRIAYDRISNLADEQGARKWRWLHAGVAAPTGPDEQIDTPLRWGPVNADHARLTAELIGHLDLNGLDVVEVGCGRGGNLMAIGKWFSPTRCVGLELSGTAAQFVARSLGPNGVASINGDAEELPFPSESFDVVVCIESAGHYPDRLGFYFEAARVLRQGGWLLYAESLPPDALAAVGRGLESVGFDRRFTADVGPRVRRYWESLSASVAGNTASDKMTNAELESVGPGNQSDLGRLLTSGANGYHLMRWQRADRSSDHRGLAPEDIALINPPGDGAAAIMEAYGGGGWLDAVNRPRHTRRPRPGS